MRPFSDIIANQIIPKALSLGFSFFVFFLVENVAMVVDGADVHEFMSVCVCVWLGEVMKLVSTCVCVKSCM